MGTPVKRTQLVWGLCQCPPKLLGQRYPPLTHTGHSRNCTFAQSLGAYYVLRVDWETGQVDSCPASTG